MAVGVESVDVFILDFVDDGSREVEVTTGVERVKALEKVLSSGDDS